MVRSALVLALLLTAAPVAAAISPGFKAKADSLLADAYAATGPGAAVIVTENGKTVYAAGRGLADVERKVPITPATHFRMASITKQFTAAAVLRLAEQGKLSLDDPLSKFLPTYPAPGASATVRQLLNHSGGMMDYTRIPGLRVEANGKAYSTEQLIAVFKDVPPPSKPGEKWDYNNSGYVLLGAILEKVTGKSWDQAVGDLVTAPLKLTTIRTGIGADGTPGMAVGYTDKDGKVAIAEKIHMSMPHAAGALVGTVGDLADWGNALHNGKLLAPASYTAMTGTTTTADGNTQPYGYGIKSGDVRGRKAIGHAGNIEGFSTDSIYLPKEKIFVAVFANSDSPQSAPSTVVVRRLAALAVGDAYPVFTKVAVDPKAVDALVGTYAFADTERAFFRRDGKLFVQRKDRPQLEVFAAGANKFFYGPDSLTWFEIMRDPAGKPQFAMHQEGASTAETGRWKGPPPADTPAIALPAATLDSYAGSYTSIDGVFVFKHEGGGLTVKLDEQPTLSMKAVSANEFEITQIGAKIRFNAKDGKIGSITMFLRGQELEGVRSN